MVEASGDALRTVGHREGVQVLLGQLPEVRSPIDDGRIGLHVDDDARAAAAQVEDSCADGFTVVVLGTGKGCCGDVVVVA